MNGGGLRWPSAAVAIGCVLIMAWLGSEEDRVSHFYQFVGENGGAYNRLADGFLEGHLYLKTGPGQGLLDTALFRGHYYLYYGVVPEVIAFLPYRLLTGWDLSTHLAVLLFIAVGFFLSTALYFAERRRQGLQPAPSVEIGAILVLAFGAASPFLLTRAFFYEVPIASGYACAMGCLYYIHRACFGSRSPRTALAAASLALGLAVGCRPNYVLGLPLLPAAVLIAARERGVTRRSLLPATLLPAAVVGLGLAAYNYARFGSVFEFGFKYGQNNFFVQRLGLFSPAFFWPNLRWYYLTPPWLSPFFPYVFPEAATFLPAGYGNGEAIHGQFPFFLLAVFAGVSVAAARRPRPTRPSLVFAAFPAYLALVSLVFMCLLGIRANRYVVDFQAPLAVALVLATAGLPAALSPRARRIWTGAFAALTVAVASFNVLGGLQQFYQFRDTHLGTWERFERLGNRPSEWAEHLGWLRYGPLKMRISFPRDPVAPGIQPLFVLGSPGYDDGLYEVRLPDGRVELWANHHDYGDLHTEPLVVVPGRPYDLTIRMGALYPPLTNSFYRALGTKAAKLRKSSVEVELDGRVVLEGLMPSYDDSPRSLELGRNDFSFNGYQARFDGQVLGWERLAPEREPPAPPAPSGCWRLRVALPPTARVLSYPLLAWGVTGAGNLLYLSVVDGGRIRFGLDQWGYGGAVSGAIAPGRGPEHTIEVFAGAAASRYPWPAESKIPANRLAAASQTLVVWLDGRPAWVTSAPYNVDSYGNTQIGSNPQGFSTAVGIYTAAIRNSPYALDEAADFVRHNLDHPIGHK